MSVLESDISWQTLRRIAREWFGASAELAEVRHLVGGCINSTVAITLNDGGTLTRKVSTSPAGKN